MRSRQIGATLLSAAALVGSLAACGGGEATTVLQKATNDKKLTIGVKYDQPGMGLKKPDGTVEGFDVDVAKYIAKELGVEESGITWKEARSANRETFLQQGQVDLIVATYSITEARKPKVTFAGPFYVAHQDTLVRADDTSITSLDSLKGKRICQVTGSNSWKNIAEGTNLQSKKIDVTLVAAGAYDECITKLKGDALDAVTTDDMILAGYAKREGSSLKVTGAPFTDEKYGVGLKKGDKETCEAVNKAITKMYSDGTIKTLFDKHFSGTGLNFTATAAPPAEGCA
ncbi:glutamate ABC transporter substrate-binding protein [Sphaerisporangium sp. TRM90804]|uniref:glutamate ABC transporter substrate-binding protein n=1 Tax=Sphaerisporangium sp. TRM90804 TaxID=3031113 RepID=UPI0024468480|nr:glutamate ABC transporter substrate-binding protein [Sphaerisporangium sp. TRM90804]MDH2425144.1 glutamate ABC transporter substrate-binding protein [Sphaerisporangium sp. TRM90804]